MDACVGAVVPVVVAAIVDDLQLILNPIHFSLSLFLIFAVQFESFRTETLPLVLLFMFGCHVSFHKAVRNRGTDLMLDLLLRSFRLRL